MRSRIIYKIKNIRITDNALSFSDDAAIPYIEQNQILFFISLVIKNLKKREDSTYKNLFGKYNIKVAEIFFRGKHRSQLFVCLI